MDANLKCILVKKGTKEPARRNWQQEACSTPLPGQEYGVRTGDGLVVVDVDMKKGRDGKHSLALLNPEYERSLKNYFSVTTPSGGIHYYFTVSEPVSNRTNVLDGVDVRGDGGFVKQIGGGYVIHAGPIPPLPEWLRCVVLPPVRDRTKQPGTHVHTVPDDEVRQLLDDVSADCDYENWRNIIWSCCSLGYPELAEEWSRTSPKFDQSAFDKVVESFDPRREMDEPLASFRECRVMAPAAKRVTDEDLRRFYPEVEPELEEAAEATSASIHESVIEFFAKKGQEAPQGDHDRALRHLSQIGGRMFFTDKKSRIVFPLFCGGGKTVSVAAMALCRPADRGLLIACGTISALEQLREMLIIDFGIPADQVGCTHTREGGESIEDVESKPIVLCTHQRVKGYHFDQLRYWCAPEADELDDLRERVVVWDETLITTKTELLPSQQLFEAISAYTGKIRGVAFKSGRRLLNQEETEMIAYLDDIMGQLWNADPGTEVGLAGRPQLISGIEIDDETLKAMFTPGVGCMYVNAQRDGITFRLEIDDQVKNILVLDASAPIRHLARFDPTLNIIPVLASPDCSEVTIHWTKTRSGKRALNDSKLRNEIARWIAENVASKHSTEPTLVLVSRDDGERRDSLVEAGMIEGEGAGQFKLLSFGEVRALNTLTNYRVGVNFGNSFREPNELKAAIAGQKRKPASEISDAERHRVMISESADTIYQGLMRLACRQTEGGKAKKVDFYLIHPYPEEVLRQLRKVMPGLRVEELDLEPRKQDPIQAIAAEALSQLRPEEGLVSLQELRSRVGVDGDANRKPARKFNIAVQEIVAANADIYFKRGKAVGVRSAA